MRLLHREAKGQYHLTKKFREDETPVYAILSHTWGRDEDEVTFEDMEAGLGQGKIGYNKIRFCAEQAARDQLEYFWVDTCCIKKTTDSEVTEAINSMFRWYKCAAKCYVYLEDVPRSNSPNEQSQSQLEEDFQASLWHSRCWTLPELLAPPSLEFFSREWQRLGDKKSLEQQIHNITKIPLTALRGHSLSTLSNEERMGWVKNRNSTRVEDKTYCLLGIFDIFMPQNYGEGENALVRFQEELKRSTHGLEDLENYQEQLRVTDLRDDKARIESMGGALEEEPYQWILHSPEYQQWQTDPQTRLLWLRGDPGTGKTMLMCGVINTLETQRLGNICYFFCQATDSRINSATAVVRSLLYALVEQQPSLVSYLQNRYNGYEKGIIKDVNNWIALRNMLLQMVQDSVLRMTYLIIDGVDECLTGRDQLLGLIKDLSKASSIQKVKCMVSSRHIWQDVHSHVSPKTCLHLELNEQSTLTAVNSYIQPRLRNLAEKNTYDTATRKAVQQHLTVNAHGNFLWVALVCEELIQTPRWEVQTKLNKLPPGVHAIYKLLADQLFRHENAENVELRKNIMAVVSTVYRPITLDELASFIPNGIVKNNYDTLTDIIQLCRPFLTLRGRTIFFIHQSAKEYLLDKAIRTVLPLQQEDTHYQIYSRSLEAMTRVLRRDIYKLIAPGSLSQQVVTPNNDPLSAVRYSCTYWIQHLLDCNLAGSSQTDLCENGAVDIFLRQNFLYWLEALSLLKSTSDAALSVVALDDLLGGDTSQLATLVRDGCRFIQHFHWVIKNSPLQIYAAALIFSPTHSVIRQLATEDEPRWINAKPIVEENWSPCIQTLDGHGGSTGSVDISCDGRLIISGSIDGIIRLWDRESGTCIQTLEEHMGPVNSVAFSSNGRQIVSGSSDNTIKIWDTESGA